MHMATAQKHRPRTEAPKARAPFSAPLSLRERADKLDSLVDDMPIGVALDRDRGCIILGIATELRALAFIVEQALPGGIIPDGLEGPDAVLQLGAT
jgi:hypothetical protein